MNIPDVKDEKRCVSWADLRSRPHAEQLTLNDVREKFASKQSLSSSLVSDAENSFVLDARDSEISHLLQALDPRSIDVSEFYGDARKLYYFLEYMKSLGDTTYPEDSPAAQRHLFRMVDFLSDLRGSVLDIGANNTKNSISLFPQGCDYLGCDPFIGEHSSNLVSCFAEELPFREGSFDAAVFNTSLDHILDYYSALSEAARVLKPGGRIIVSGYAWLHDATLLRDHVHFHHFRYRQLTAALDEFGSEVRTRAYECPKGDTHRVGIYLDWRVHKK